jgi:hypothetical protein
MVGGAVVRDGVVEAARDETFDPAAAEVQKS